MDAIEVLGISKEFKENGKKVWALQDVSFTVKKGEIFGLLGPNGAGKTTLLNIMARVLVPDKGKIRILGIDVQKDMGILERINTVSGDSRFHWVLRTEDILKFYAKAYGIPEPERSKRIKELIAFFDIQHVSRRKFTQLSTGERMRLIFAKAMLNHPEVLLLDEPTLGLDPSIAIRVREEIIRVNKNFNTAVLLTSHYMNEVEQLSDRIAFIYEGKIVDMGSVEKVKTRHFGTYQVFLTVKNVKDTSFLRKSGFAVQGRTLKKELGTQENLSEVLAVLHQKGYSILDVKTKRPTLEDYFVKILMKSKTKEVSDR